MAGPTEPLPGPAGNPAAAPRASNLFPDQTLRVGVRAPAQRSAVGRESGGAEEYRRQARQRSERYAARWTARTCTSEWFCRRRKCPTPIGPSAGGGFGGSDTRKKTAATTSGRAGLDHSGKRDRRPGVRGDIATRERTRKRRLSRASSAALGRRFRAPLREVDERQGRDDQEPPPDSTLREHEQSFEQPGHADADVPVGVDDKPLPPSTPAAGEPAAGG